MHCNISIVTLGGSIDPFHHLSERHLEDKKFIDCLLMTEYLRPHKSGVLSNRSFLIVLSSTWFIRRVSFIETAKKVTWIDWHTVTPEIVWKALDPRMNNLPYAWLMTDSCLSINESASFDLASWLRPFPHNKWHIQDERSLRETPRTEER